MDGEAQLPVIAIDRQGFFASLASIMENSEGSTGLILINLSNLPEINEQEGYLGGDHVIAECFNRLAAVKKLPDTLFRVSGHHFAFILPSLINPSFIVLAVSKLKRLLVEEIKLQERTLDPEIHIGIAMDSQQPVDVYGLFRLAEESLARAKRGKPHDFTATDVAVVEVKQHELEKAFKQALQANEFELYYQPKLNYKTGRIDKAEALLRWQLPGQGFISPELVVDLAEQFGESYTLTKWVIHTAVRQAKAWQNSLGIAISVNVQAGLLAGPDLVHLVGDSLAIWGLESRLLNVEITESAVIEDKESGLENLLQLKATGVSLSIDDFGTGYSSLSYFKDIPANELKIDKSFVMHMLENEQDQHIVKIIIEIAHLFNLEVVAEGVEDRETQDHLKELGCDYAQGYFIAKALPVAEFEQWIEGYHFIHQYD
jgi:diguanylate cyclase (GGDEF)-like protein